MSIEAMKCTKEKCLGFIVFENADFNYKDALNNHGHVLDEAECTECKTVYKIVVAYRALEIDEHNEWTGYTAEECCITDYEKRQRELDGIERVKYEQVEIIQTSTKFKTKISVPLLLHEYVWINTATDSFGLRITGFEYGKIVGEDKKGKVKKVRLDNILFIEK